MTFPGYAFLVSDVCSYKLHENTPVYKGVQGDSLLKFTNITELDLYFVQY